LLTRRVAAVVALAIAVALVPAVPGFARSSLRQSAGAGKCPDGAHTGDFCAEAGQPGTTARPAQNGNYVDPCTWTWIGEDPDGGGSWYMRSCPTDPLIPLLLFNFRIPTFVLLKNPPPPERAARNVLAKIHVSGAKTGIAPNPGGSGLVGLWVWLWTEDPAHTWGPVNDTAKDTETGLTAQISAQATRIDWNMGDGSRPVACDNPGRPYSASDGVNPPPCGYQYQKSSRDQPGGQYTITATTTWRVTWKAGASSGVFVVTATSDPIKIRIDELQVVVR
jgi:hypothetical protein